VKVSDSEFISHILFVDDIFYNIQGSIGELVELNSVLELYCRASGMEIKFDKYSIIFHNWSEGELRQVERLVPAPRRRLEEGFKYLGFFLKPNNYQSKIGSGW
jgi:hypothetical protein